MDKVVEVKICGLTNRDDALVALEAGADYLGFVLYQASPRHVSSQGLGKIIGGLPPCRAIAVCVNMPRADVEMLVADYGLYGAQVHGNESAMDYADFPVPLWRAVKRVKEAWQPAPEAWRAKRWVVDAVVPGEYGGTGVAADWAAAAALAAQRPVMLAGGLTPENVAAAIRAVKPCGVDVSSGVESTPGHKDAERVRAFIRNVKGIDSTPVQE